MKKMLEEAFIFIALDLEGIGQPKDDAAGGTLFGITKRWYPEQYQKLYDILFGSLDRKMYPSIENLLGTTAMYHIVQGRKEKLYPAIVEIYRDIYAANVPGWLKYPTNIFFFDFAFNANPKWARIIFQKTINDFAKDRIKEDGVLGKHTKAAYKKVTRFDFKNKFAWEFMINRRNWYTHNPQRNRRCSWINRCNSLERFILLGGYE